MCSRPMFKGSGRAGRSRRGPCPAARAGRAPMRPPPRAVHQHGVLDACPPRPPESSDEASAVRPTDDDEVGHDERGIGGETLVLGGRLRSRADHPRRHEHAPALGAARLVECRKRRPGTGRVGVVGVVEDREAASGELSLEPGGGRPEGMRGDPCFIRRDPEIECHGHCAGHVAWGRGHRNVACEQLPFHPHLEATRARTTRTSATRPDATSSIVVDLATEFGLSSASSPGSTSMLATLPETLQTLFPSESHLSASRRRASGRPRGSHMRASPPGFRTSPRRSSPLS